MDYAENATMHGIAYAFERRVVWWSRLFWAICAIGLFVLAIVLIVKSYINWQDDPVLTTVSKTGLPITEVDFPAVTICGLGSVSTSLDQVFYQQVIRYLTGKKKIAAADIPRFEEKLDDGGIVLHDGEEILRNFSALEDFMQEEYPSLQISPIDMAIILSSQNPDSVLESRVALGGGVYDECDDLLIDDDDFDYDWSEWSPPTENPSERRRRRRRRRRKRDVEVNETALCGDMAYSDSTGSCYEFKGKMDLYRAKRSCGNDYGVLVDTWDNYIILALADLIKNDKFKNLPKKIKFWSTIRRDVTDINQAFETTDFWPVNENNFGDSLTIGKTSDTSQQCFTLQYDSTTEKFVGEQADCDDEFGVICETYPVDEVDCSAVTAEEPPPDDPESYTNSIADKMLNPDRKKASSAAIRKIKRRYKETFRYLNMRKIYDNIFELLWYSQLPCFDVEDYSSLYPGERSVLKQCSWKGVSMSCSAIFSKFPTDRGMCCAFNLQRAEKIFVQSNFAKNVQNLQGQDKKNSYVSGKKPKWYKDDEEPKSQVGTNKGLRVVLDAHTNLIADSSVREDFQGFIAIVNPHESYPLTMQRSIRIKPGHDNLVAMSATKIRANEDIRDVDSEKRYCYFHDEHPLRLHQNYSQSSCVLECQMEYAQEQLKILDQRAANCTPWFLPVAKKEVFLCDPWRAVDFVRAMEAIPSGRCAHCLPDCAGIIYTQTSTSVPFRRCDNKNLGVSPMCNLQDNTIAQPPIYGHQLMHEYKNAEVSPWYIKERFTELDNYRSFSFNDIFNFNKNTSYDAYEYDIATVEFYFETPTVFEFYRSARMGPIDFLSQVGGLLGLCVGFSLCSLIELLYWFLIRIPCGAKKPEKDD